ncbi:protein slit-like, partial [Octopus sinensis]|uniref:Protein slit-like n=1 Tax=Octopus sinensis TaxID=2607531 RepID=A0A6P7TQA3_9MOLL
MCMTASKTGVKEQTFVTIQLLVGSHRIQRPNRVYNHCVFRVHETHDKSTPGNMFRHIVSYRRSLVLILCTILFLEAQADSDICKICTCNSLTTKINCDNRNLASIPQPIPTNVEYLDLQDNNIATIQEGVFTGLKNLKQLSLKDNKISRIEKEMFQGLQNLQELILWNNKISTIEEDVFTRLSDLTSLDLDGNDISTIKDGSFNGLSNLTKLDLRNNKISTIKEGTFTRLSNLNYLYLQNNLIEKYEDGAFLFLRSIVEINLENNNLMKCGCHLPAFVKYIKKVYNRIVDVRGMCLEGSGKRIPILDYSQCQNYWLFQRNLQCQTCSGISCNDSNVRSCPGAEPVCRFAISMNGAKLKTERSCSTYRKCVEAMRNNNITCNKRTNSTSCTGCCVGHLCNKNDFIDYSLYQRNLQCQTCSGMKCTDLEVTSCPGAEPVCRFAISVNGAKLKTERSCSTYRKCVEAMRNNNITCNKRTNSTACTGCCVGHLCNKNDFIDYSLYQRNLQCQTCSGMKCTDLEVTSCPGAEPVCRFAISVNGAKLKTERSCSTYRKCVEAMRNNNITCNKRTNSTACTGCCVGHLCNKNDFI